MSAQRRVVCATNQYGPHTFLGARHFDTRMLEAMKAYDIPALRKQFGEQQGFIDQWGGFMCRKEALIVARSANQVKEPKSGNPNSPDLFSEDLY